MKVKISEVISYWRQNPHAFCSILGQYFYENKQDLFNGLKIDILYISGLIHRATKDELLSFYKQIKYIQINAGHFVMLNSPDQFNKVVNEFLV
jgi:pimeloyl-ACP methyl ester carboxylesterase